MRGREAWARYLLAQFKRESLPLSRTQAHQTLLLSLRAAPDFPRLWRHVGPADDLTPLMPLHYCPPGQSELVFTLTRMQFVGTPEVWDCFFASERGGAGSRVPTRLALS